jgi:hypothetical protein
MKKNYIAPSTIAWKMAPVVLNATSLGMNGTGVDDSRKSRMFVDDGQDYYDEEMEATAAQSTVSSQSLWD